MSLYVRGSVNKLAKLSTLNVENKEGWKVFDESDNALSKLAAQFKVFVTRESLDYDPVFVITNVNASSVCLWEGDCFTESLNIEDDLEFDKKADAFISAMQDKEEFSVFKNLEFCKSGKRYFVSS